MKQNPTLSIHKRPTDADVARAAGVSRTAVSFVMNNTPGRTISAATKQRILAAAQELGYQPSPAARALRKGYGDEICLFSASPLHSYIAAEWITTVQDRARELGYSLAIHLCRGSSREAWRNVLAQVFKRRPVGIIGTPFSLTQEDCVLARTMGVRGLVLVDAEPTADTITIAAPHEQVGQLVGRHLVERGHRRIGCVVPRAVTAVRSAAWRSTSKGLKSALSPAGVTLVKLPMEGILDSARAAVESFLQLPERPTAIYSFRDEYGLLLLRALQERGLRVPADVALVGTEDGPMCGIVFPSLTSVRFDIETVGAHLVDLVDAQVRGKAPAPELLVFPPPQLIVRESS